MADRYFEVEDELGGKGRVYDGTEEIAVARYNLQILHLKIQTGAGTIDGRLSAIEGHITPLDAAIGDLFRRDKLTLIFEDGKELDFYIKNGGTGQIQALGSIRDQFVAAMSHKVRTPGVGALLLPEAGPNQ